MQDSELLRGLFGKLQFWVRTSPSTLCTGRVIECSSEEDFNRYLAEAGSSIPVCASPEPSSHHIGSINQTLSPTRTSLGFSMSKSECDLHTVDCLLSVLGRILHVCVLIAAARQSSKPNPLMANFALSLLLNTLPEPCRLCLPRCA